MSRYRAWELLNWSVAAIARSWLVRDSSGDGNSSDSGVKGNAGEDLSVLFTAFLRPLADFPA